MLIDWFTVAAQIVNFLVLVALLKRFLFSRIIQAIDDREKGIAARLAEAQEMKAAAARDMEQCRAAAAEQQQKGVALLEQAKHDAEEERKDMIAQARENVRALEDKWRIDLELQQRVFLDDLRKRAATGLLLVARQAMGDLASCDLQQSAIEAFLGKFRHMDFASIHLLEGELTVVTPELPSAQQQHSIRAAIENRLGPKNIRFRPDASFAWGIELRANGRKIGWTPDTYLDGLEDEVKAALETREAAAHQYAA